MEQEDSDSVEKGIDHCTDDTECGASLPLDDLTTLGEGEEISIKYPSVYSDEIQTIEAVVGGVYKQHSESEPITWFDVPLKPSNEDGLRTRKRECYRDHEHLRRLSGYIHQQTGAFVTVEALNGGRWHNITAVSSTDLEITICRVDARNDCTLQAGSDQS